MTILYVICYLLIGVLILAVWQRVAGIFALEDGDTAVALAFVCAWPIPAAFTLLQAIGKMLLPIIRLKP